MKRLLSLLTMSAASCALLVGAWQSAALAEAGDTASAELTKPVITSVRVVDKMVSVQVDVPAGYTKITLESRARFGAGAWQPRAVQRIDGTATTLTFEIPISAAAEMLRVRGDEGEPLPAAFYKGETEFNGPVSESTTDAPPLAPGAGFDDVLLRDATGPENSGGRDVVESDIWSITEDTLYFFNQFRGLQVVDLTDPDSPALVATLDLPAVGEQMYRADENHVVLLARDGCNWDSDAESRVLVVEVSTTDPSVVASLSLPGQIQESRMVGTALYVASQTYRRAAATSESVWEWGTIVSAFDLEDPAQPVARNVLWYPGYGNVVTATEEFLFVSTQPSSWRNPSLVQCIDISSPDAQMAELATIRAAGFVADKFKLNVNGDVLTIISERRLNETNRWRPITVLETFSLADPANPERLGQLQLADGESLFATRFDGDRVYVVTFLRIDPLWVVDLSDPRRPTISGELEIPGWSTYIHPLGDKLVTVGVDNVDGWRVAVSLFDVADVKNPALLSKVSLGENHSWSEANQDEKALTVLADQGLILVPFQGMTSRGYASQVQLIDLNERSLEARGMIEHEMQPRRTAPFRDRILSISGRELLTVDATDRDQPVVTGDLELSSSADRVLVLGDYLLTVSGGDYWSPDPSPAVRISTTADPTRTISSAILQSDLSVAGLSVKGDHLYLVQAGGGYYYYDVTDDESDTEPDPDPTFVMTVFDLTNLPNLQQVGQVTLTDENLGWLGQWEAVWPGEGLVVWASRGGGYYGPFVRGIAIDAIYPWWGGSGGRMLAFNVTDVTAPTLASDLNLAENDSMWWSQSDVYSSGNLVYLSRQTSIRLDPVEEPEKPVTGEDPDQEEKPDSGANTGATRLIWTWVQKHYLTVIDYSDPSTPTIRQPVNIPGTLRGLSHGGAVIYTIGNQWDENGKTDWNEWLSASAYDGVSASLIDSLELSRVWPYPVTLYGGTVFLGKAPINETVNDESGNTTTVVEAARLESWALADTGQFQMIAGVEVREAANDLRIFDDLLVKDGQNSTDLYDANAPESLTVIGSGDREGCLWLNLMNADGSVAEGLWAPLGAYGLTHLEVNKP